MKAQKIAYCWELGAGLGHVTRIDSICNLQEFANTEFSFVLKETNKATFISKANKQNVYQAPEYNKSPAQFRSPNYAHIMLRCGWQNKDCAYELVANWLKILKQLKPDVVFLDFAPSAAIAAKILQLPYLFLGNGFEFPPAVYPFPSILPKDKVKRKELIKWHDKLQKTLDSVHKNLSTKKEKLDLIDIFSPDYGLVVAHPMLDHYNNRPTPIQFLPLLAEVKVNKNKLTPLLGKPSIFLYLRADTANLLASLRLLSKDFHIQGYIPKLSPAMRANLHAIGVDISATPLPVSEVMASSQLVICHCGIGTVANAIALNLPLVLIPTQVEQSLLAHTLCELGVGVQVAKPITPEQFVHAVKTVSANQKRMQSNIKSQSQAISSKAKIWNKSLSEYLDAI